MKLNIYQVDAFAERTFEGNPAAVCPLETWLDDTLLQQIAAENNLSETAFFVPSAKGFHLRWFTPVKEVDLCGHATLAAAHVLFNHLDNERESMVFESKSGDLFVHQSKHGISMDFPADPPHPVAPPKALLAGLGLQPVQVLAASDYVV
ncbi:MAG: PhzF family phenazine biosynthesis protein, partial [Ghiorsea sp.]